MIITRAPLRIPLGGGGTDLASYYTHYGGFVLSAGIDKYVYIQLNDLEVEDFIRVKYSQTEKVDAPDQIQHPLLREALIYAGIEGGIEISAMSDVPGRTGLGSSGAFTVALLAALRAYKREQPSPEALAEEAHYIEAVRAAQPAGKHDHYLGTFGGLTCLDIDTSGRVAVAPLAISAPTAESLAANMLVFFTGIRRESSDILAQQNQDTQQGDDRVHRQPASDQADRLPDQGGTRTGRARPLRRITPRALDRQKAAGAADIQCGYRPLVRGRPRRRCPRRQAARGRRRWFPHVLLPG